MYLSKTVPLIFAKSLNFKADGKREALNGTIMPYLYKENKNTLYI